MGVIILGANTSNIKFCLFKIPMASKGLIANIKLKRNTESGMDFKRCLHRKGTQSRLPMPVSD